MNQDPLHKKCIPCEGGVEPLKETEITVYSSYLTTTWEVVALQKITQKFVCKTFQEAIVFVNKIAAIAEQEGHHPDIHIHYNKVIIELTTHAIHGLSVNDFILARKIEEIQ